MEIPRHAQEVKPAASTPTASPASAATTQSNHAAAAPKQGNGAPRHRQAELVGPAGAGNSQRRCLDWRDWALAAAIYASCCVLRLLLAQAWGADLAALVRQWDGQIYLDIAQSGYRTNPDAATAATAQERFAFFPGLPGAIFLDSWISGLAALPVALVIVNLSAIAAVAGCMALGSLRGASRAGRVAIAIMVSAFPMAITFTMVYTEAPFLAAFAWFLVAVHRRNYTSATILLALVSCLRLTAIDISIAVAVCILVTCPRNWRAWRRVLVGSLPLGLYVLWASWHTRAQGGYFGLQAQGWHSHFDFGKATWQWWQQTWQQPQEWNAIQVGYLFSSCMMLLALGLALSMWRWLPPLWWLSAAGISANVLLSDGIMHSRPRLLLPALVIFLLPLAQYCGQRWRPGRRVRLAALAVAWIIFGTYSSLHMVVAFPYAI